MNRGYENTYKKRAYKKRQPKEAAKVASTPPVKLSKEIEEPLSCWAIVELMGHRKLAGFLLETSIAGARMFRLDVPDDENEDGGYTQFFSPSAVYAFSPITEEAARRFATLNNTPPFRAYEVRPGEFTESNAKPPDDGTAAEGPEYTDPPPAIA